MHVVDAGTRYAEWRRRDRAKVLSPDDYRTWCDLVDHEYRLTSEERAMLQELERSIEVLEDARPPVVATPDNDLVELARAVAEKRRLRTLDGP